MKNKELTKLKKVLKGLDSPNIELIKPGCSKNYYDICRNLEKYLTRILSSKDIIPIKAKLLGGESNVNVKVITKNSAYVIRINPWKNELIISNCFYKKAKNIPCPKVKIFDESHTIIPYDYQIINFIKGDTITNFDNKFHKEAGILIGESLHELHKIQVSGFGAPISRNKWNSISWLETLREVYLKSGHLQNKNRLFTSKETQEIEDLTFFNYKLKIKTPKLIHSDIGVGNSLFEVKKNKIKLVAIIDPGSIIGGDPMFDLAMTTSENTNFSKGIWESYNSYKISKKDIYRYNHLQLLCLYWTACYKYSKQKEFRNTKITLLTKLEFCKKLAEL